MRMDRGSPDRFDLVAHHYPAQGAGKKQGKTTALSEGPRRTGPACARRRAGLERSGVG
jgi:hypothetical protein